MMKYRANKDYLPAWLVITKMVMTGRQIDVLVIDPGCPCHGDKQADLKNADGTLFTFQQVEAIVEALCKVMDEDWGEGGICGDDCECQAGTPMEEVS